MFSSPFDSLPTLPGENLLGHIHSLKNERLAFLRRLGSLGPLARIRLLHRYVLFANSPQTAHQVLVEHASSFEKSPGIRLLLHDLGGEGLFTSEGDLWKKQRRLMSPLFHPSQLSTYVQAMNGEARRALERWSDGAQLDLQHEMTRIAMGVVGSTLFGSGTFNEAHELGEALTTLLGWVDEQGSGVSLVLQITALEFMERLRGRLPAPLEALRQKAEAKLSEPILLAGRSSPKMQHALRTLDGRMLSMIRERRERPSSRKDLLTRLLLVRDSEGGSAASGMSDKQVRDEANTLFIAGHETTATALAWCFYLLARHPEARAKVQAEADAFGPDGPTASDPQALAYTTRVFKEALRLYPPVFILARRTLEPVRIGDVELPTRTVIFVSPYTVHLSPEVWPDPDRFDPDRFLPEREAVRHKSAWIPFGVGPRVCIGNYFALLEGPIVLATLMRRARFEIDPNKRIEPDAFATLRPAGGVPATVRLV